MRAITPNDFIFPGNWETNGRGWRAKIIRRVSRTPSYLLVFPYFLLRAHGAVPFPLLVGGPEIVLGHPAVENPNAVDAHEQHSVGHQLTGRRKPKQSD